MKPETPFETMTRCILASLRDLGRCHNGGGLEDGDDLSNDIFEVLKVEYRRAGMDFDWRVAEECLSRLIAGRQIRQTHGKWEDEIHYTLRPKLASSRRQPQLFA